MNAIGQRTSVATSGTAFPAIPSWNWTYDPLGQVIAADSTVATSDRSYQYDTIGNRQKSADSLTLPAANNYAANSLNQYTSFPSLASVPSYDFDGNMTSGPLPTAPTTNSTLTWDAENRLISSTVGGVTTTYQYDAQSRRIAKIAGTSATTSASTLYLYDAWNCIAEYSSSLLPTPTSTLQKTRLWGPDLSGTPQGAGGVAGLLSESHISNPQSPIYYPNYDGNGNIIEYLTATGTIAAHFEYDPFGNTVVNTDTANLFNYRFSTKSRDQETGLCYYGYRYYDPSTGRWPSRDPIEESGGLNLYAFVENREIQSLDYLGLSVVTFGETKTERTLVATSEVTPYPGGPLIGVDNRTNGVTVITNIVKSLCECVIGSNNPKKYILKSYEVSINPTVYLRAAESYNANQQEEMKFHEKNEGDHVADYKEWAATDIVKKTVDTYEKRHTNNSPGNHYNSEIECQDKNTKKFDSDAPLKNVANSARSKTITNWDTNKKHTWKPKK